MENRNLQPTLSETVIWDSDLICLQTSYWSQPLAQTQCPLMMGWGQKNEVLFYNLVTCRLPHNSRYTFTAWADYGISSHLGRDLHVAPLDKANLMQLQAQYVFDFLWNTPPCLFYSKVDVLLWRRGLYSTNLHSQDMNVETRWHTTTQRAALSPSSMISDLTRSSQNTFKC